MIDLSDRQKYGKYAGYIYAPTNITLLFKGIADRYAETDVVDFSCMTDDPYAFTAGLGFISFSMLLATHGENNKVATFAAGLNMLGNVSLVTRAITRDDPVSSLIGTGIGFIGSIYTVHKYRQAMLKDNKSDIAVQENKASQPQKMFLENAKDILRDYPLAPVGIVNLISAANIFSGAVARNDWVMAGVAMGWGIGAVVFGLSKPKEKNGLKPL